MQYNCVLCTEYTVHSTHTPAGYFHLLKWKETNKSALAQAGPPPAPGPLPPPTTHSSPPLTHKGAGIILAGGEFIILFYGAGRRGSLFCGAACDTAALFVSLWERKQQKDQYILYAHFQQRVTCVGGKWAGSRILCLLWIWHELGPRRLRMWWMYYFIFLSLFTWFWLPEWMKQHPQFGLWTMMKYNNNNGCNNRAAPQGPAPVPDTLTCCLYSQTHVSGGQFTAEQDGNSWLLAIPGLTFRSF